MRLPALLLALALFGSATARAASVAATSVAVMPFDDVSPDPQTRWLERGMAAQLAADLAMVSGLRVTPRVQTNQLAQAIRRIQNRPRWSEVRDEVTRRFRADWCVSGEFARDGDRLELRAWLGRRDQTPQPLPPLTSAWNDLLSTQDELAVRIARMMGYATTEETRQRMRDEPTASLAAYEQFLRGLAAWDAEEHPHGDRALARTHYEAAVRLDDRFGKAHNNLGVVCEHEGQLDAAERHCRRALALMPNEAVPQLNLANVFMKRRQYAEALEACEAAKRVDPRSMRAYLKAGVVHQRNGRIDYAEAEIRNAVHADPACAMAHVNLGVILFNASRTEAAAGSFRRAIEAGNDALALAYAHNNLGNVHRRSKHWDQALAAYVEALRWKDDYAVAAMNLGDAHLAKGNRDQAAHWYQEALRMDPALEAARRKLEGVRSSAMPA